MSDPAVDSMVSSVRQAIESVTGSSLVGLYLFGSLSVGDFDADVSDIDLIAVLADGSIDQLAGHLSRMHEELAEANPERDDRIEVIYISTQGLANCRTNPTTIAVISPGEPFHVIEAGRDWILNWYPARQNGVRLVGPPIDSLIPPIPAAEFVEEIRRSLIGFTKRIADDAPPGAQAYAILTMCRGLYAIRFGELLSKREAASWARQQFPQWADLIHRASGWRQRRRRPDGQDGRATVSETRSFVIEMAELATGDPAVRRITPA